MAATTAAAQRNIIETAIAALSPSLLPGTKFSLSQDEGGFVEWSEANPASCLRRFTVRHELADHPKDASNMDTERRIAVFTVTVAYPNSYRYGSKGERSQEDILESDQHLVEGAIGLRGKANFPDATWQADLTQPTVYERGEQATFMVVRQALSFWRSFT